MKIVVITVGKPGTDALSSAIADYESRISHYFNYESLTVKAERIPSRSEPDRVAEAESERLLARVPAGLETVALDRRGKSWTSMGLASYLEEMAVLSRPGVAFLVGGPLGHSESLRRDADRVFSLSDLTLPHELAYLLLVEQIYRAGTIHRGEPYHKGA